MSANNPTDEDGNSTTPVKGLGLKAILRFVIYILLMPLALFLSAGTLNWPMGWAFIAFSIVFTLVSRGLVALRHPDLLRERGSYAEAENAKKWDKLFVTMVALYGTLLAWVVAGLDYRFGWSPPLAPGWQLAAFVIIVLCYSVSVWAMAVNRFFSSVVRIQTDRGHTTITTGPYRVVRHPSYSTGILAYLAIPVFLGTLWALIPTGITAVLTIVRTAMEDRTLLAELDGYQEYAQRVRYRLVPGVW